MIVVAAVVLALSLPIVDATTTRGDDDVGVARLLRRGWSSVRDVDAVERRIWGNIFYFRTESGCNGIKWSEYWVSPFAVRGDRLSLIRA